MKSRAVQTNVLELLGVDDYMGQSKRGSKLRGIEEESFNEMDDLDNTANQFSQGFVNNVLANFEGF